MPSFEFRRILVGTGLLVMAPLPLVLLLGPLALPCYCIWIAVIFVTDDRLAQRRRRVLETHRYHVCTHCSYPLDTLVAVGFCPECGRRYTHDGVKSIWHRYYPEPRRCDGDSSRIRQCGS